MFYEEVSMNQRNKLKVNTTTFGEYIELHYSKDKMWEIRDWNKDKKVYIISR